MGKKGKAKTAKKKAAKKLAKSKGKKIGIKDATKIAKAADKQGIDLGAIGSAALSGIPFVGPVVSEIADQALGGAFGGGPAAPTTMPSRGGKKGVMLVDASTQLNLGTISRKKALSVLTRRKPVRRSKKVVLVPAGQEVRVI